MNVVCVLRSGPEFRVEHVKALANGVAANMSSPYQFICLTDLVSDVRSAGVQAAPLSNNWPGWWSKICLFAPQLFDGPTIYFDLDTVIVGSLDQLVYGHRFTMCSDFQSPGHANSSMMAWDQDLSRIYKTFMLDHIQVMSDYTVRGKWGDQDFISHHTPLAPEFWQTKNPGMVVSYKMHVRGNPHQHPREIGNGRVPAGARVVCFHGKPRPWQTSLWQG